MMTDPTAGLGGMTEAQLAADLAAKQAGAPLGVTSIDPAALIAAIEQLQKQVADLQAAAPAGRHPLLATAEELLRFVAHVHPDTAGHQLAQDLVDAAGNAVSSGQLVQVERLTAKLSKWLHRNSPPPGENYHYRNAVQIADFHLPDQVESFVPAPRPLAPLSGGAPVQVVAGSVTG